MSKTDKELLMHKRPKSVLSKECAVSTGSTLLNLACTDRPDVGFMKGGYYFLVGDSTSGKTWLSMTCFAEAARNSAFKDYEFVFDNVEDGAQMDVEFYFGKEVARRMIAPSYDKKGNSVHSTTVQSFYYHITKLLKAGKKIIYALDSQDALTSDSANDKFEEQRDAYEKGKDKVGSYGDGKAKIHSENIRGVLSLLKKTGSILVVIGQTRDNVATMSFEKKTRSGGKALKFYANLEMWTSVVGRIKKTVRGHKREVGVLSQVEVRKNRVTGKVGKDRSAVLPIYNGLGIDDVGSCVDFLIEERHWRKIKKKKGEEAEEEEAEGSKVRYDASDLMFEGTRNEIVRYVEAEDLESKLIKATTMVWHQIEEECQPTDRKRRYE